ncbi:MAG: hypothetical protein ACI845_004390 [Gammaproteobacteria bacterium]|jgi:hypothetical protein
MPPTRVNLGHSEKVQKLLQKVMNSKPDIAIDTIAPSFPTKNESDNLDPYQVGEG